MVRDKGAAEKEPPPGFVMGMRKSPYTTLSGPFYEIPDDEEGRRSF
ncbi:MAG: hypothetical protein QGG19_13350 [Alphaproteobacteria bacterium]|jgi:hypothetical protein|nr:hypothetical protein [Alphaproteobacteria bacterium]MDP6253987.1 hypothetical protein [Alphaproteobacteria bacterium]MDP7053063.1 hypothetical protein [Alphaproteobacteria bacterium]MDP7227584.1 hypothetical protein [Alphaproteobacteria bacterium]MDP7460369.1 hypothetical protein [Alphaproteobacteria bacterium]